MHLARHDAMLVTVQASRGSVPRDAGAWMAVFSDTALGTIGGGHLEWQALIEARKQLTHPSAVQVVRYALGPSLGQCCGGEVQLRFEPVSGADAPRLRQRFESEQSHWPLVALFGAGHVGKALVRVLGHLPLRVRWVDSRDEVFPDPLPHNVVCEHADPVQAAVNDLPSGTQVLIMSFSHAEDLEVVRACLQRQRAHADLGLIGLIGSRSKWATFKHRLQERGFSEAELTQVTCPVGIQGIGGKQPAVIAVAVAAQVLQVLAATHSDAQPPSGNATSTKET
ncbi:MAG: xanthine dehydrogenase accessory protein XdhC [Comamonadaceae bacterium]|nr:xanthine dehydrogenase accessory protein XdhC [Comamonadaceae bacterium]